MFNAPPTTMPPPAVSSERIAFHSAETPGENDGLSVLTLALWTFCLLVGSLGLCLAYPRPRPAAAPDEPIIQRLQVELTEDALPPAETEPPPSDSLTPPPPPDALEPPLLEKPIAVAQPSPAIAFALPIEVPARIVPAKRAEYTRPPEIASAAPAASPQRLTYGQGEGRQPAPDYPLMARREGQEGTVVVRLTVAENGRVLAAEAFSPSPWPLLNEAALHVVRERWRFPEGFTRIYDVAIRFELSK